MSEIEIPDGVPEETYLRVLRAFFGADPDSDHPSNGLLQGLLEAPVFFRHAVAVAFQAGRESAYTTDDPKIKATKYTVAGYPEPESINAYLYDVDIEYRGKGRWAVCWMGRCYDKDGVEDYEPTPSSREDDWLDRYRFDTADDAIAVAKKVAATLTVNGKTAAQCWEWEQARQKEIEASDA